MYSFQPLHVSSHMHTEHHHLCTYFRVIYYYSCILLFYVAVFITINMLFFKLILKCLHQFVCMCDKISLYLSLSRSLSLSPSLSLSLFLPLQSLRACVFQHATKFQVLKYIQATKPAHLYIFIMGTTHTGTHTHWHTHTHTHTHTYTNTQRNESIKAIKTAGFVQTSQSNSVNVLLY